VHLDQTRTLPVIVLNQIRVQAQIWKASFNYSGILRKISTSSSKTIIYVCYIKLKENILFCQLRNQTSSDSHDRRKIKDFGPP